MSGVERRGPEVKQKTGWRRRTERIGSKRDGIWRKMRRRVFLLSHEVGEL